MDTTSEKACFKCGSVLPLSGFYKHPQMGDGHLGKCKACTKRDVSKNRDLKLDRVREYDRKRGNRSKPETVAKWLASGGRVKRRAHELVSRAVRRGDLTPRPCQVCGETEKIHAHHDDYSKALDVRWLCAKHHRQHHAGRKID